jgi:hypothetical protein
MTPSVTKPSEPAAHSQEYYPGFDLVWTHRPYDLVLDALLRGKTVIIPLGWRKK